jgi:hypothetical protein
MKLVTCQYYFLQLVNILVDAAVRVIAASIFGVFRPFSGAAS